MGETSLTIDFVKSINEIFETSIIMTAFSMKQNVQKWLTAFCRKRRHLGGPNNLEHFLRRSENKFNNEVD